jgi:hypothetical protein
MTAHVLFGVSASAAIGTPASDLGTAVASAADGGPQHNGADVAPSSAHA